MSKDTSINSYKAQIKLNSPSGAGRYGKFKDNDSIRKYEEPQTKEGYTRTQYKFMNSVLVPIQRFIQKLQKSQISHTSPLKQGS